MTLAAAAVAAARAALRGGPRARQPVVPPCLPRTLHPFSPLDALLSPRADIEFISARVDPGCLARLQQVGWAPGPLR